MGRARETASDEELMADVAAGDREAFACLSRRHLKRSLALAARIVGNSHDAEEIVQDAFVQVWFHADKWRGDRSRFTTWLYRIVVNRSLDYRRRRQDAPLEEALEVADGRPDAEALVEVGQIAQAVEAALAALPERQRAALALCFHGDMSCSQASKVLEVSVSAMESLLVRARRTVRNRLRTLFEPGPAFGPGPTPGATPTPTIEPVIEPMIGPVIGVVSPIKKTRKTGAGQVRDKTQAMKDE
jgi:RNA polymerase sigma-70 factor (ECF subfamily)